MAEEVKILTSFGFIQPESNVVNYCRERLPWYLYPIFVMEVSPNNLHIIFVRLDLTCPNRFVDLYISDLPERIWEHYIPKTMSEIIQDLQED